MLAAILAVLLSTAPEPAERLRVEWLVPAGCPGKADLAAALTANLPANRTFWASIRIDEPRGTAQRWRAVVTITSDGVERTRAVDADDCARVTDAAVLVVTLAATAVAEEAPFERSEHDSPSAQQAPPAPTPVIEETTLPPMVMEPPAQPFSFHLQPILGANLGLFPVPGVSAGLSANFGVGRARAEVMLSQWFQSGTFSARGSRFDLSSAKLKGTWLFDPTDAIQLGPCIGSEMGVLSAQGVGISRPSEPQGTFWAAVLAGATAGFTASSSVRPWVTLEAGVNLVQPAFVIVTATESTIVHQTSPVLLRLSVGVQLVQ